MFCKQGPYQIGWHGAFQVGRRRDTRCRDLLAESRRVAVPPFFGTRAFRPAWPGGIACAGLAEVSLRLVEGTGPCDPVDGAWRTAGRVFPERFRWRQVRAPEVLEGVEAPFRNGYGTGHVPDILGGNFREARATGVEVARACRTARFRWQRGD
jgi:hypothetical protein